MNGEAEGNHGASEWIGKCRRDEVKCRDGFEGEMRLKIYPRYEIGFRDGVKVYIFILYIHVQTYSAFLYVHTHNFNVYIRPQKEIKL